MDLNEINPLDLPPENTLVSDFVDPYREPYMEPYGGAIPGSNGQPGDFKIGITLQKDEHESDLFEEMMESENKTKINLNDIERT